MQVKSWIGNLWIFCFLLFVVMITNFPIIHSHFMYPEQPSIYIVNQTIHHLGDLLQVYLHPIFLHADIAFFRPSGHFLIYQLLTPFLGWHNSSAFFVVSFLFLTVIGYFMVLLYQRLFPGYSYGGWVAFGFYLMHPALSISKLTFMHFDFAYIAFMLMSFYLFIHFFDNALKTNRYQYGVFACSLFLYALAVTFKESAIMLGPIMVLYACIATYPGGSWVTHAKYLCSHRKIVGICAVTTVITTLLALYLLSSWPEINYGSANFEALRTLGTINLFFKDIFAIDHDIITRGYLATPLLPWRTIVYSPQVRLIVWILLVVTLYTAVKVCIASSQTIANLNIKKSWLFISISSGLFLILPFCWGMGGPWHYSLMLITLGLLMGFSVESLVNKATQSCLLRRFIILTLFVILALYGVQVNQLNIAKYENLLDSDSLGLTVNQTAVLSPPPIQSKLTKDSIILIEDSYVHSDYLLGNAAYPYLLTLSQSDYELLEKKQQAYLIKYHHTYSGNLFRYAYLMPEAREEVYPFEIDKMNVIPNEVIYRWYRTINNIFCLGYDKVGNWHDKTEQFKATLMNEMDSRQLKQFSYVSTPGTQFNQTTLYNRSLPYPDESLCQYTCDQDKQCGGFVMQSSHDSEPHAMQCQYFSTRYQAGGARCDGCRVYQKTA